jgi:pyrroline-5-carboxylate reductase
MAGHRIVFIGAGNMARTMASGLLAGGVEASTITMTNRSAEKLETFKALGMQTTTDNVAAVKQADVVILAVKPYQVAAVCAQIGQVLSDGALVVSVAAGVPMDFITQQLGQLRPVFAAMPNIAAAVEAGVTGLCANEAATDEQLDIVEALFSAMGMVVWLEDENELPAVTAVSGSGIAYFFQFMAYMQSAAQSYGLPADVVKYMIAQTALGAAKMALELEDEFVDLSQQVASPQGATAKGLEVMDAANMQKIVDDTMQAVIQRFTEMTEDLCN